MITTALARYGSLFGLEEKEPSDSIQYTLFFQQIRLVILVREEEEMGQKVVSFSHSIRGRRATFKKIRRGN